MLSVAIIAEKREEINGKFVLGGAFEVVTRSWLSVAIGWLGTQLPLPLEYAARRKTGGERGARATRATINQRGKNFAASFKMGYDLRFGRPPFVSHQKWHGWNCQVDIIPHGCCPVAETKINAFKMSVCQFGDLTFLMLGIE
jgi:hypothetical protein